MYANVRFGDVTLPDRVPTDDLSTGVVESALQDSIGATFDTYGNRRKPPRTHKLAHRGKYVGETTYIVDHLGNYLVDDAGRNIVAGNAAQMLQGKLDAIKGKVGERDQLWRKRLSDSALQWKYFRLLAVKHLQGEERAGNVAELDCEFESAQGDGWHAEDATTATVNTSSGSAAALVVGVSGETVNDAVLTVECTSGSITTLTIVCAELGIDLAWTGNDLVDGNTLTIDCGEGEVPDGAEDVYNGFVLGPGHTARGWLPLSAGHHLLMVTTTGGASTTSLNFYEQFP